MTMLSEGPAAYLYAAGRRPVPVTSRRRRVRVADPLAVYSALSERFGAHGTFLLESSAGPAVDCQQAVVGFGPLLTISIRRGAVSVTGVDELVERAGVVTAAFTGPRVDGPAMLSRPEAVWDMLRALQRMFGVAGSPNGFSFGFLSFFGYDAVRYIERLPWRIEQQDDETPDICLVLHQGFIHRSVATGEAELVLHESPAWPALDAQEIIGVLARASHVDAPSAAAVAVPSIDDSITAEAYEAEVRKCLDHIAIGDIYQVQIGHRLSMDSPADPVDVYRRLRERNPSPFMYLASLGGYRLIGASPELFVRVQDGIVTMRPIAGTIPRHGSPDDELAERLREDPKEIAEHTMLVDLCRNDIGRICRPGTLDACDMFAVEAYSHVLHMVSTVTGSVDDGVDGYDVVTALFPSGTMTGAPKIRAMEIIEAVETSRRGIYAGSLGLLDVGGYLNLALCIRTLVHDGRSYRTRASAGVVADSQPVREWNETRAKLSAAVWAVTGQEYAG